MSQRGLEALLRPKSIAVIGASMKPDRAGYLMMRNLLAGGFNGPVMPVTPAYKAVQGCWRGRTCKVYRLFPTSPCSVRMRNETSNCLSRSVRKAVKPALFFPRLLNSSPNCWPAPAATRCAFLVQIASVCLRLARAECQFFPGSDP